MNDWFAAWGLSAWKPWLQALLLSPIPLFVLAFIGGGMLLRRRRGGLPVLLIGLAGLWAASTVLIGTLLIETLTRPPDALEADDIARLKDAPHTAIVVLGAGRRVWTPEYDAPDVQPLTLERLRYGLWLARRTGLPVLYSGGIGYASAGGPTEAEVASEVAERDFALPLRWTEDRSRDTAENAQFTVELLHREGITRIVLVTHGFHQQRARAAFERALRRQGVAMTLVSAGVGLRAGYVFGIGDLLPGPSGLSLTLLALHEWVGWLAGA